MKFSERLVVSSKIKTSHVHQLTHDLTVLLRSGIPLSQALTLSADAWRQSPLQALILDLQSQLESGNSFADALMKYPQYFDSTYCALVRAGESSGNLEQTLQQLHLYQKNLESIKGKISKALVYPCCVLVIALIISACMLTFIMPQFIDIFSDFNVALPLLTRWVIALSDFVSHYGTSLALLLAIAFYVCRNSLRNLLLRTFPTLTQQAQMMRWCYIVAIALQHEVPMTLALDMANAVLYHSLQTTLIAVGHQVSAGQSLSQQMQQRQLLDQRYSSLLVIAENAGRLAEGLQQVSALLQQQFEAALEKWCQLIEPAIMLLLALILGVFIMAIYLPIFQIGHFT